MKILQNSVSENHQNAMFYHGVIAEGSGFKLETYQDGEIIYNDELHIGDETPELANFINDEDLEDLDHNIEVDKFFAITKDGELVDEDDLVFNDYDEAIEHFEEYLRRFEKHNAF
jgi:hypothetical protein